MAALDKLSKLKKLRRKHIAWTSALKNLLFELDIYAYTPSLAVTPFSTWISLVVSLSVIFGFIFSVAYTSYLWLSTPYSISQGEISHANTTILVPDGLTASKNQLGLPQAGVMLLLGNGSVLTDPKLVKIVWQQATICSGSARGKYEDTLPTYTCTFVADTDGKVRADQTLCPDYASSIVVLRNLNNTASNPCQIEDRDGAGYHTPRIAGTFYDQEYSYLTATVSVDAATILRDKAFFQQLMQGSVQLYMVLPYTSGNALASGAFPADSSVVWSRRVNLYPNVTMKWEVSLRIRQVSANSYWWDVPFLDNNALDYSVMYSEMSMAYLNPVTTGFVDMAKIYLKLDDRDLQVTLAPFTNLFNLFGDWGGFLSILMMFGIPAMIYNQNVFRSTVTTLMEAGKITFNEELRRKRSQAIHTSFAIGLGKSGGVSDMQAITSQTTIGDSSVGANSGSHTFSLMDTGGYNAHDHRDHDQGPDDHRDDHYSEQPGEPKAHVHEDGEDAEARAAAAAAAAATITAAAGTAGPADATPLKNADSAAAASGNGNGAAIPANGKLANGHHAGTDGPAAAPGSKDSEGVQEPEAAGGAPHGHVDASAIGAQPNSNGHVPVPAEPALPAAAEPAAPGGIGGRGGTDSGAPKAEARLPLPFPATPLSPSAGAGAVRLPPLKSNKVAPEVDGVANRPSVNIPTTPRIAAAGSSNRSGAPAAAPAEAAPGAPAAAGVPLGESLEAAAATAAAAGSTQQPQGGAAGRGSGSGRTGSVNVAAKVVPDDARLHAAATAAAGGGARFQQTTSKKSVRLVSDAGHDSDDDEVRGGSSSSKPTLKDMAGLQAAASIMIKYEHDIFEDSDEDEHDFDDVVRHCTSECLALYHLRQVVKLVQSERSFLTCGSADIDMVHGVSERARSAHEDYDVEALAAEDRDGRAHSQQQQQQQQQNRQQARQQQLWQQRRRQRAAGPPAAQTVARDVMNRASPLQTIEVQDMLLPQQVQDGRHGPPPPPQQH